MNESNLSAQGDADCCFVLGLVCDCGVHSALKKHCSSMSCITKRILSVTAKTGQIQSSRVGEQHVSGRTASGQTNGRNSQQQKVYKLQIVVWLVLAESESFSDRLFFLLFLTHAIQKLIAIYSVYGFCFSQSRPKPKRRLSIKRCCDIIWNFWTWIFVVLVSNVLPVVMFCLFGCCLENGSEK